MWDIYLYLSQNPEAMGIIKQIVNTQSNAKKNLKKKNPIIISKCYTHILLILLKFQLKLTKNTKQKDEKLSFFPFNFKIEQQGR